jgi:hypothetical protein
MAQTGYTPISLYYSTTAAAVPVNTNLANGELAINITDGKLYYKDNGGTVRLLASNATSAPVLSFQTSLSGLTPSTATTGVVTLAGTLGAASGGTGLTTLATGSLTYGAGTSAFSTLAIGTAGQILTVNSGATAPQWSTLSGVAVTTFSAGTTGFTPSSATAGAVTLAGTLATTNGGTGLTSFTSGGVVYASSTSALATGSALTFDGTNLSSTGGATFQGGPTGYGGGEIRLGSTASGLQNGISTQGTGTPQIIFDHRGTSNTGTFTWRNGTGGTNTLLFLGATGNMFLNTTTNKTTAFSGNGTGLTIGGALAPTLALYDTTNTTYVFNLTQIDADSYLYNTANGFMAFGTNNAEGMRLTSTGLAVGVGGANGYKARIYGGNDNTLVIDNDGSRYTTTNIANNGTTKASMYWDNTSAVFVFGPTVASSQLVFSTVNTERARFDASGNLGIGTSSPRQKLSVGATLDLYSGGANTPTVPSIRGSAGNNLILNAYSTGITYVNFDGGTGGFVVANGAGGNLMIVDSSGNVGIGTSSPADKLEVYSTITARASSGTSALRLRNTTTDMQWQSVAGTNAVSLFDSGAGLTRLTVDSSGNLGLGVTPSSWGSGFKAVQLSYGGVYSQAFTVVGTASNSYNNGTNWIYYSTGQAVSRYEQSAGSHAWYQAVAGTAGNAISFTQAMTLDASGNLFVGVTSGSNKFNIGGYTTSQQIAEIYVSKSGSASTSIGSGAAIQLANSTSSKSVLIQGADDVLQFWANNGSWNERARIDSSGNLLVGTTSTGPVNANAITIEPANSRIRVAHSGTGNTTPYIQFDYNGSNIASITQNTTSTVAYNTASSITTGAQLNASGVTFPATQVASADANTLDDYEEGTWTPSVGGTATYNSQNGSYIKIGQLVYVHCYININVIGTGSTTVVSGLPFNVRASSADRNQAGSINYFNGLATSVVALFCQPISSSTTVNFPGLTAAGSSVVNPVTVFASSAQIYFSAVYQTNS